MQKIDIHLDDFVPEEVSVVVSATDDGTQICILLGQQAPTSKFIDSMTFDTFVVGESNQFAHAAAKAIVEKPGQLYNPLIIYGEIALGKTHLLHAIGNALRTLSPETKLMLTTGERFQTEFLAALRHEEMVEFRGKYYAVDGLIFDVVHFLDGKERTIEELFQLLGELVAAGKQVVIAIDKESFLQSGLVARIRSHFDYALFADLQKPDEKMRRTILTRKAELLGLNLPDEVSAYLVQKLTNVRMLEGCLIWMKAAVSFEGGRLDLRLTEEAVARYLANGENHAQ